MAFMSPRRGWVLSVLALLAIVAYAPALTQPFIEDDYPNIVLAQHYGPLSGWPTMLADPVFRLRTTGWLLLYGLNRAFGMHAAAYYAASILLHVISAWLVYAMGVWRRLGFRLTACAAAFFAVYEGHQEAVMWVSAANETLMAGFGLAALICWIRFLEGGKWAWYAGSIVSMCAALLSKESAVILVPLLALPLLFDRRPWPKPTYLIPIAAMAALCAWSIFHARAISFRFQDGSFSLHAPFWLTWPNNYGRLFWIWGLIGLTAVLVWKPAGYRTVLFIGASWAGIALLPYSFLTYSNRIPSRQTYLASVGIAIIVGLALLALYDRYWSTRPALVMAVCTVILVQNVTYLWTKKRSQFLARAAPTERLIALARSNPGPIYVRCFPRPRLVADSAIELMAGGKQLVWDAAEARRRAAITFCG
jgi:hypothetical protein